MDPDESCLASLDFHTCFVLFFTMGPIHKVLSEKKKVKKNCKYFYFSWYFSSFRLCSTNNFNKVTVITSSVPSVAIIYAAKYALMRYLKWCIPSYFYNAFNSIHAATVFVILSTVLILMDFKRELITVQTFQMQ